MRPRRPVPSTASWGRGAGLAFLLAALAGCGTTPESKVIPLSGPVDVRVHENLLATGRTLQLDLRTEDEYGCYNFTIAYLHYPFGSTDLLQLLGVNVPSMCLTALGPARATVPFGVPRPGAHALRITALGTSAAGALAVSADSIVLTGVAGPWVRVPEPVLHRVPPGTVWGLIGWGPSDRAAIAQAFVDSLHAAGAQAIALAPGNYDYFLIGPDGTPQRQGSDGYWFARPFVVRMEGDRAPVAGVIGAFADSLSISAYGDRGEAWYSWVLHPGGY